MEEEALVPLLLSRSHGPPSPTAPGPRPQAGGPADRSAGRRPLRRSASASRSNCNSPPPTTPTLRAPATFRLPPPTHRHPITPNPVSSYFSRLKWRRTQCPLLAPPTGPTTATSRVRLSYFFRLLPAAPTLAKLRHLPFARSNFWRFKWFFGGVLVALYSRTGYPVSPARLMRSGITRKWRRKRWGSSFKFVRANPAVPGHAGNAGCLHSCQHRLLTPPTLAFSTLLPMRKLTQPPPPPPSSRALNMRRIVACSPLSLRFLSRNLSPCACVQPLGSAAEAEGPWGLWAQGSIDDMPFDRYLFWCSRKTNNGTA